MGGFDQRSGNHSVFFKYRHIGKAIIHPYIPSHKSQMTVTPFHFDEHFGIENEALNRTIAAMYQKFHLGLEFGDIQQI